MLANALINKVKNGRTNMASAGTLGRGVNAIAPSDAKAPEDWRTPKPGGTSKASESGVDQRIEPGQQVTTNMVEMYG